MTRGLKHGLVIGKFLPLHAGHSRLIREAELACDRVTVELLASRTEPIPREVRAAWIAREHPNVRLVAAWDEGPVDFDDATIWDAHMNVIAAHLDAPVDAVFTSDDYGQELARRLGASWIQVDPGRIQVPISGTAVRDDPFTHWWALSSGPRAWYARRVVVVGAESTGSTTLSLALADALSAPWVEEYGRTYCETRLNGTEPPWQSEEFMTIARQHIALEDAAAAASEAGVVVCDTDVLATALWHERYLGFILPDLARLAAKHVPACYILTSDDIPFVQDGWRDGEDIRPGMSQRFRDVLAGQSAPWTEVSGAPATRLAAALEFTKAVLGDPPGSG